MKRCTQCGEEKPRSEFYARASAKDGRRLVLRRRGLRALPPHP